MSKDIQAAIDAAILNHCIEFHNRKPVKAKARGDGRGWAWAIKDHHGEFILYNWAEPSRHDLLVSGKPSPEAKAVQVKITLI